MSKKRKAKHKTTAKRQGRPLTYNKGSERLVHRLPQMRLTEQDFDLLSRARLHRVNRTRRIEPVTEFVRQAIRDAAERELGKG